jgi:YrbI family 3-deoxy-D-manno-octulosonate 8-phosphate phosphatase
MSIAKLCQPIELILSDVDGVLTDGSVVFNNAGIETKLFHIRDGMGIKLWQRSGGKFGIVTGRSSHIVQLRAAELGVSIIRQGVDQKVAAVKEVLQQLGLQSEQLCYIGDDLPDLPAIRFVGLGVAVADASEEVRHMADHVTTSPGGAGAVRELIETILKSQRRWDDLVRRYVG